MPVDQLPDARRQLLDEIVARVPGGEGRDCVRVAVDGVDGSGKTTFADHLAERLRHQGLNVVRVSADGFHHVRAVRYQRGRNSPEGFWLDSYDYPSLQTKVLDPFGPGGSRRYQPAVHDVLSDQLLEPPWRQAPPGSILVVDGLFLHRDELADVWNLSIFLQVPFAVSVARMAARDSSHPDPQHPSVSRYVKGQQLYFAACAPWLRADLVVDNTNYDVPRLIEHR